MRPHAARPSPKPASWGCWNDNDRLWDGLDGLHERYSIETVTVPSGATHLFFTRQRH